MKNDLTPEVAFSIWGVDVHRISSFYSLNDLHKAAGGDGQKLPKHFIDSESTQKLIESLENGETTPLRFESIIYSGEIRATTAIDYTVYACKEIAILYANWLNPSFYVAFLQKLPAVYTPLSYVPTNLIRYVDFDGKRGYCVTDFSVPYFGMDSDIWVSDFFNAVGYTANKSINESVFRYTIQAGFDGVGEDWFATRRAICIMLNLHHSKIPESARLSLFNAFLAGHEPPLADAHSYPITPVFPLEQPAQPIALPVGIEDGRYLLIIREKSLGEIIPLGELNLADAEAVRAIANNATKLAQQCALLTGKGDNDILTVELEDVE